MVKSICVFYEKKLPETDAGCWYDDFCWWGIAFAKAWDPTYNQVIGSSAQEFEEIVIGPNGGAGLWRMINAGDGLITKGGAPNVWKNAIQLYEGFKVVAPRFEGGVWQYDMFAEYRNGACSPSNPCSPIKLDAYPNTTPVNLGPYQLSVIISLYLVLASRLAAANVVPKSYADRTYGFINNWCDPRLPADITLINRYNSGDTYGLMRERVSSYLDGAGSHLYADDVAWAGDQGLYIGGLLDYYALTGTGNSYILARKLAIGAVSEMQQFQAGNDPAPKVFSPWVPYDPDNIPEPFASDPGDYTSGLGVFMRYLYYATTKNIDIRKLVQTSEYQRALTNVAAACIDNEMPLNNWTTFNTLATMITAIEALI